METRIGGHKFWAHERWFAELVFRRQRTHRTESVVRVERQYGPDGIALMAAGLFTMVPGELVAVVGLLMVIASGHDGAVMSVGVVLLAAGVAVIASGAVRIVQAIPVGRAFRALS